MSMSTPAGGGSRRPLAKPAAGAKPNLDKGTGKTKAEPTETTGSTASPESTGSTGAPKRPAAKSTGARPAGAKSTAGARSTSASSRSGSSAGTRSGSAGTKSTGGRSTASSGAGARSSSGTGKPATKVPGGLLGGRPAPKKAGGRKTFAPVKVSQGRNWGPIALFAVVILVALGIVGFGAWKVYEAGLTLDDRIGRIDGLVNYRESSPDTTKPGQGHSWEAVQYPESPPVAGKHNFNWQNCMGDVYTAPIKNEHAVHSLEHGAVWLAYNPDKLSKDQIDKLAAKINGKEYTMMSPYPGLDRAISLQAWGYQLKLDNPNDKRIDRFVSTLRKNASVEPGVTCSGGITETGVPLDFGKQSQEQQQQQPGG